MTEPARQRFAARLSTLRDAQGRTQAQIGHHLHVTADAVRKWQAGRLPDADTARELDAYLNADGALYRDYLADSADRANRTRNRTAAGQALSATTVLADSAQQAAEFGTWAETTNVGEVAITTLHIRMRELAHRALSEPPAIVANAAADLNGRVFELLRGHHSPAAARDLYATAGWACGLLAWLAGDLGALDLAAVHNATARRCAAMSENPEVAAWTAAVDSKTWFWAEQYAKSAQVAEAAAALAAPGTAAVMLACQQADAYAKLGDPGRTIAALEQADRSADTVTGPDSIGGLFSCRPGRAANYAASCRLGIDDAAGSIAAAETAFAAFNVESGYGFGTVAQTRITQAFAFGASSQWDAMAAALRPVLDLPPDRRLETLTARLTPMAGQLAAPALRTSRTVSALREEINAYCERSARKALPAATEEYR